MSDKNVNVPSLMLKKVLSEITVEQADYDLTSSETIHLILFKALGWLSENPIIPTALQYIRMVRECNINEIAELQGSIYFNQKVIEH